jgi:hypothetical protein
MVKGFEGIIILPSGLLAAPGGYCTRGFSFSTGVQMNKGTERTVFVLVGLALSSYAAARSYAILKTGFAQDPFLLSIGLLTSWISLITWLRLFFSDEGKLKNTVGIVMTLFNVFLFSQYNQVDPLNLVMVLVLGNAAAVFLCSIPRIVSRKTNC